MSLRVFHPHKAFRPVKRALCGSFFALALGLALARLFTGIVYEYDDPTSYFVVKHRPSLDIIQENSASTPIQQQFLVLDADENELLYQPLYVFIMKWAAPEIALLLCLTWFLRRP
jgi:hypothetical protein